MSIFSKVQELQNMRKPKLLKLQGDIEIKQLDLENAKESLQEEIDKKRKQIIELTEIKSEDEKENKDNAEKIKIEKMKLEYLEKTYSEKVTLYKDNLETLKAISQIFKIREEQKSVKKGRLLGLLGLITAAGGIGLAYGADTLGSIVNKKTYDAAKMMLVRLLPISKV